MHLLTRIDMNSTSSTSRMQAETGHLSRRRFLAGAAAVSAPALLAACTPPPPEGQAPIMPTRFGGFDFDPDVIYAALREERFPLDGADLREVDERFLRTMTDAPPGFAPGTIVIDTSDRFLFLVLSDGRAVRYGVGVGRQGASWRGRARIARKAEWPSWTPTANMIRFDPEKNGPWAGGMPGGPDNPLGARALYLYDGNRDTMYRIHGTNEPWSIGTNVSSGCIRLINHDIIDLHARVPMGTSVVVRD
jgi:lipoprotein-anchoring transpeptidase ErfK/SrfK